VKKLIAIAFTCVYLLLTVGVIKNTHYCMGRINDQPPSREVISDSFTGHSSNKNSKNSPEFFILSDLYSEALIVLLA
jgi:predicted permease